MDDLFAAGDTDLYLFHGMAVDRFDSGFVLSDERWDPPIRGFFELYNAFYRSDPEGEVLGRVQAYLDLFRDSYVRPERSGNVICDDPDEQDDARGSRVSDYPVPAGYVVDSGYRLSLEAAAEPGLDRLSF